MNPADVVKRAEEEGFEDLENIESLPARVRAESMQWASALFAPEKSPYGLIGNVRRLVHRASANAPDLVRHEYDAGNMHLVVTEGRSFVFVKLSRTSLDLSSLSEQDKQREIMDRASLLLGESCQAASKPFAFPERIDEGACFSTDADLDPRLICAPDDRLDGGIRNGELYFIAYKRLAHLVGWLDPYSWFRENGWVERGLMLPRRLRQMRRQRQTRRQKK